MVYKKPLRWRPVCAAVLCRCMHQCATVMWAAQQTDEHNVRSGRTASEMLRFEPGHGVFIDATDAPHSAAPDPVNRLLRTDCRWADRPTVP